MNKLCLFSVVVMLYATTSVHTHPFDHDQCPICYTTDLDNCPPLPETCEKIWEENCGCCKMCAKTEGEACGRGIGNCASGLLCKPTPDEYEEYGPTVDAYLGRLECIKEEDYPNVYPELYRIDLESNNVTQPIEAVEEIVIPRIVPPEGFSRTRSQIPPSVPASFRGTSKFCFEHLQEVVRKNVFHRFEWIPGCKRNGTYRAFQCEQSQGQELGRCWCVNKRGKALRKTFLPNPSDAPDCPNFHPEDEE